jgi:2,4-dienoyl-CoA reductase-like NADH-dependent reductase (Old Yellow Enzyme family)
MESWWWSALFITVPRRNDEWGGSGKEGELSSRCKASQDNGPDYPVLIKLGLKDYHPAGKTVEEGINSACLFIKSGIDAIEVSEGIEEEPFHHIRPGATSPYYLEECRKARNAIGRPLILVGGMRNLDEMQMVVDQDLADAVSLCRPFIMDQYIVGIQEGQTKQSYVHLQPVHRRMTSNLHCVFNPGLIQS